MQNARGFHRGRFEVTLGESEVRSNPLDFRADIFLRFPQSLLQPAQEFLLLAFRESQVVIGQLTVLLLQLAFDLVPMASQVHRGHIRESPMAVYWMSAFVDRLLFGVSL
jgi:hypothetical protein